MKTTSKAKKKLSVWERTANTRKLHANMLKTAKIERKVKWANKQLALDNL